MCLVLAFTNTKNIKLSQCVNSIGNTLLASEGDGFGYAALGSAGVFGEKTTARRFRTRLGRINFVQLPIVKPQYSMFGTPAELTGPAIFHGRTSTNVISLPDTHPMQIAGWNLIHNGVVDDLGPLYEKETYNDSEDVLRRLIDGVGKKNPMEDIEKYLQGYYAFAAIDPQGRLHIGRDDLAPLHIAYSAKLDTFIIGTTEGLILKTAKILDAKIGPIDEIECETYCIFNGNDLIHCQDFKTLGYTKRQSDWASQSLGRELPNGARICGLQPPTNDTPKDVTPSARQEMSETSEADWQSTDDKWHDSILDFLQSETHPDRGGRRISEDDYYRFKSEIDNMDASYMVYTYEGKPVSIQDFKKLDHVQQEQCTIIRGDGTVVDPECYETPKLRGRHGL